MKLSILLMLSAVCLMITAACFAARIVLYHERGSLILEALLFLANCGLFYWNYKNYKKGF